MFPQFSGGTVVPCTSWRRKQVRGNRGSVSRDRAASVRERFSARLGNMWEGVSTRELVARAGGAKSEARFALVLGYDYGWTTNLPLEHFLAEDALIAITHDGEPLTADHGGPARLIIPQLYAWKSAKWIAGVEFLDKDRAGFWESNGYHMRGDPWQEERYSF